MFYESSISVDFDARDIGASERCASIVERNGMTVRLKVDETVQAVISGSLGTRDEAQIHELKIAGIGSSNLEFGWRIVNPDGTEQSGVAKSFDDAFLTMQFESMHARGKLSDEGLFGATA